MFSELKGKLKIFPIFAIAFINRLGTFKYLYFFPSEREINLINSFVEIGSLSAILYIPEGISSLLINSFIIKHKFPILQ